MTTAENSVVQERRQRYAALLFLDFETDDLNHLTLHPLEVAWALWDPEHGEYVSRVQSRLMVPPNLEAVIDGMPEYVRELHQSTGLLDELRNADPQACSIDGAENAILKTLDDAEQFRHVHLAGMGVASFDHPILRRVMPTLNRRLHYRTQDSSVIRHCGVLANCDLPDSVVSRPPVHRAAPDVEQGVDDYAYFQKVMRAGVAALNSKNSASV